MKKYIFGFLTFVSFATFSCKNDKFIYDYPNDKVYFAYTGDSVTRASFIAQPAEVVRDTVYIRVNTMGFVANYDREVKIVQADTILVGKIVAEPGVHYVAFNSPEMKGKIVVPAGKAKADIPIILLRDKSLLNSECLLYVKIVDNENFKLGFPTAQYNRVIFSEMLSMPKKWNYLEYHFGVYGQVKHKFLIDNSEYLWDDDYIDVLIADYTYMTLMSNKMKAKLVEENARLKELYPDDPYKQVLRESDGTEVKFSK